MKKDKPTEPKPDVDTCTMLIENIPAKTRNDFKAAAAARGMTMRRAFIGIMKRFAIETKT